MSFEASQNFAHENYESVKKLTAAAAPDVIVNSFQFAGTQDKEQMSADEDTASIRTYEFGHLPEKNINCNVGLVNERIFCEAKQQRVDEISESTSKLPNRALLKSIQDTEDNSLPLKIQKELKADEGKTGVCNEDRPTSAAQYLAQSASTKGETNQDTELENVVSTTNISFQISEKKAENTFQELTKHSCQSTTNDALLNNKSSDMKVSVNSVASTSQTEENSDIIQEISRISISLTKPWPYSSDSDSISMQNSVDGKQEKSNKHSANSLSSRKGSESEPPNIDILKSIQEPPPNELFACTGGNETFHIVHSTLSNENVFNDIRSHDYEALPFVTESDNANRRLSQGENFYSVNNKNATENSEISKPAIISQEQKALSNYIHTQSTFCGTIDNEKPDERQSSSYLDSLNFLGPEWAHPIILSTAETNDLVGFLQQRSPNSLHKFPPSLEELEMYLSLGDYTKDSVEVMFHADVVKNHLIKVKKNGQPLLDKYVLENLPLPKELFPPLVPLTQAPVDKCEDMCFLSSYVQPAQEPDEESEGARVQNSPWEQQSHIFDQRRILQKPERISPLSVDTLRRILSALNAAAVSTGHQRMISSSASSTPSNVSRSIAPAHSFLELEAKDRDALSGLKCSASQSMSGDDNVIRENCWKSVLQAKLKSTAATYSTIHINPNIKIGKGDATSHELYKTDAFTTEMENKTQNIQIFPAVTIFSTDNCGDAASGGSSRAYQNRGCAISAGYPCSAEPLVCASGMLRKQLLKLVNNDNGDFILEGEKNSAKANSRLGKNMEKKEQSRDLININKLNEVEIPIKDSVLANQFKRNMDMSKKSIPVVISAPSESRAWKTTKKRKADIESSRNLKSKKSIKHVQKLSPENDLDNNMQFHFEAMAFDEGEKQHFCNETRLPSKGRFQYRGNFFKRNLLYQHKEYGPQAKRVKLIKNQMPHRSSTQKIEEFRDTTEFSIEGTTSNPLGIFLNHSASKATYHGKALFNNDEQTFLQTLPAHDHAFCSARSTNQFQNRRKYISLLPAPLKNSVGVKVMTATDVLSIILSWKVVWLEHQEKYNDPPPVCTRIQAVRWTYSNFQEYFNTYLPLLLTETWQRIYHEWKREWWKRRADLYDIKDTKAKTDMTEIECFTKGIDNICLPWEGDLVILKFFDQQDTTCIFGYVANLIYRSGNHTSQKPFMNSQEQTLCLSIKINFRLRNSFKKNPVRIQPLYNLKSSLNQVDALRVVELSPLCQTIIHPYTPICERVLLSRVELTSPTSVARAVAQIKSSVILHEPEPRMTVVDVPSGTDHLPVLIALIEYVMNQEIGDTNTKILVCTRSITRLKEIGLRLIPGADCDAAECIRTVILANPEDVGHPVLRKLTLAESVSSMGCTCEEIDRYIAENNVLQSCDVLLSIVNKCHESSMHAVLGLETIIPPTVCILDEAHMSTESETLVPLLYGTTKFVLFNPDDRDKPRVKAKIAKENGFNQSLVGRICKVLAQDNVRYNK